MYVRNIVLLCILMVGYCPTVLVAVESELARRDVIRLALEANPEVLAAQHQWEKWKARAQQAGAFRGLELELKYEELAELTGLADYGKRSFGARQSIEFPLKWWLRRRGAQSAAQAIELSVLEKTRADIILRVAIAYDRVLFCQERLRYNREDLLNIQRFERKAQLRKEAGDVSSLAVIRAGVEAERAGSRHIQLQNDLDDARATLNFLLGRGVGVPFQLTESLDYRPLQNRTRDLEAVALRNRPEMRGAGYAITEARSQLDLARVDFLPDVEVAVFRQAIKEVTGAEDYWRVGFGFTLPLWGGGHQRGKLAEGKATVAQAVAEGASIRLRVLLDVEKALLQLTRAEEQVQLLEGKITTAAEHAFEVATRRYQEGKATYLEVFEARGALMEVRQEYVSALFEHCVALAKFEWALGGDLVQ